jgi:small subunit ribosomal protein S20
VPNIKAAIKWTRASAKRQKRNADVTSKLKTLAKKAGVATAGSEQLKAAASAFDKAAARGIIHKNKASRKKSRLAKRANAAKA